MLDVWSNPVESSDFYSAVIICTKDQATMVASSEPYSKSNAQSKCNESVKPEHKQERAVFWRRLPTA